ncbi:MAG: hypothetical protein WD625_05940 [Balneolales bacterium]
MCTDKPSNGGCTVFIPTAPNPTSGNIYHPKEKDVFIIDVKVEDAIRTIIACGAGSEDFLKPLKDDRATHSKTTELT